MKDAARSSGGNNNFQNKLYNIPYSLVCACAYLESSKKYASKSQVR